MRSYRIAVMPGDGIGPEVVEEGLKALRQVEKSPGGFHLEYERLEAGARAYLEQGDPLPPASLERARTADAIFLGAMGDPNVRYPDGTELVPQIILRFALDLYAGIRPARLYPGVPSPLSQGKAVDLVVVRENTEGLFASLGGGSVLRNEAAVDTQVITRRGTERIARAAFEWCGRLGRRKVTCVDKANVFRSFAFFRRVFAEVARDYPEIAPDYGYVDAVAMKLVLHPGQFDVLVTENMFGDILSDLAAGLVGGLGMAPSADIGDDHAVFQPCHGTAPDIAGKGIANPLASILSAAMMLDWLGERHGDASLREAGRRIEAAVAEGLARGELMTPDLGGTGRTEEAGTRVASLLAAMG